MLLLSEYIDNPDIKSREEIFLVHLKPIKMDKQMIPEFAKKLAALTPGFSGTQYNVHID